ncbi:unnamed protein product [Agarophyton chilense]
MAKSKKTKQSAEKDGKGEIFIEILRPVVPPPPRSDPERKHLRKLMIEYGKLKRRHHIEMEIRKREFLIAKWKAIDALPHARRMEALYTPADDLPMNRPRMTDTPPIKGFNVASMTRK